MDPLSITRSIRIDAGSDAVWDAVGETGGLGDWLGARVDVEVAPGSAGTVVDHDGASRRLVVTEVDEGRRVGFVWWDEARPDDASRVVITVDDDGEGSRVTVTETVDPVAVGALGGRASACLDAAVVDVAGLADRWDARLGALLGVATGALAGARV